MATALTIISLVVAYAAFVACVATGLIAPTVAPVIFGAFLAGCFVGVGIACLID